jgi:uncharacterized RDD family membrane protein YckC
MNSFHGFSAWYSSRLGRLPVVLQILLWFLYGFLWIPLWYLGTPRSHRHAGSRHPVMSTFFPEAIELVGADRRFLGFIIDVLFGVGLGRIFATSEAASHSDQPEVGTMLVLVTPFVTTLVPEALFGRSVGKFITQTAVVRADGQTPGWGRAFIRAVVRYLPLDWLSLEDGVMWHDTWSGTRVVDNTTARSRAFWRQVARFSGLAKLQHRLNRTLYGPSMRGRVLIETEGPCDGLNLDAFYYAVRPHLRASARHDADTRIVVRCRVLPVAEYTDYRSYGYRPVYSVVLSTTDAKGRQLAVTRKFVGSDPPAADRVEARGSGQGGRRDAQ